MQLKWVGSRADLAHREIRSGAISGGRKQLLGRSGAVSGAGKPMMDRSGAMRNDGWCGATDRQWPGHRSTLNRLSQSAVRRPTNTPRWPVARCLLPVTRCMLPRERKYTRDRAHEVSCVTCQAQVPHAVEQGLLGKSINQRDNPDCRLSMIE